MLNKLYGGRTKPKINYPKPRTRPRDADGPAFVPGGGKPGVDFRHAAPKDASSVAIPRVGGPHDVCASIEVLSCCVLLRLCVVAHAQRRFEAMVRESL
jgi:hypothetical protein